MALGDDDGAAAITFEPLAALQRSSSLRRCRFTFPRAFGVSSQSNRRLECFDLTCASPLPLHSATATKYHSSNTEQFTHITPNHVIRFEQTEACASSSAHRPLNPFNPSERHCIDARHHFVPHRTPTYPTKLHHLFDTARHVERINLNQPQGWPTLLLLLTRLVLASTQRPHSQRKSPTSTTATSATMPTTLATQ
jgi:hypothetical protein